MTFPAQADPIEISGYIGADLSYFPKTGLYLGQLDSTQPSLVVVPELRWLSDSGDTKVQISAFGRFDSADKNRKHVDLREAYLRHEFNDFSVLVGINKVFWGVAESRHLVDIINQVDQLEYTDGDARLGQPMLSLTTDQDWGTLSAFLMTRFQKLDFPGPDGRLRGGLPVSDTNFFSHASGHKAKDYAVRYYNSFGNFDLGLSAFKGTTREPVLKPNSSVPTLVTSLEAHYNRVSQAGLDVQYTGDATLLKLEAIARTGTGLRGFEAMVGGFEHTVYQVADTDGDLGLIAEYNYDNRGADAPLTIFQRDLFLGTRWAANDSQDTSAIIGTVFDLDDGTQAFQGEFQRRLENGLSFKMQFRALGSSDSTNLQYGYRQDDFFALSFKHHF
ncbi:MAG: hypothetical protein P8M25_09945 [Paracoccaceae bacterium]|nr:hypothetical protein [Paracoccaceae bacterium]